MKTTPIKRSKELVPLSREHHDGLLLCWKIRTGVKNNISPGRIADYILYFFENDLKEHFRQEEEVIFTLLEDDDLLKREVLAQHTAIYGLIEKLNVQKAELDNAFLLEFADMLDKHIRFEERQLFPHIETTVEAEALKEAGEKLNMSHSCKTLQWQDEFWTKK